MRKGTKQKSVIYDDQIKIYERETLQFQEQAREIRGKKRSFEEQVQGINDELQKAKKQRVAVEKQAMSKNLKLKDLKNSRVAEAVASSESNVDDLQHEISVCFLLLNGWIWAVFFFFSNGSAVQIKLSSKCGTGQTACRLYRIHIYCRCLFFLPFTHTELAKGDFNALEKATNELPQIEEDLSSADAEKRHYEKAMQEKVHMGIESAKERFENERKVNYDKASIICPESEIEALGGCGDITSEQLQAHLKRLKLRHQQESHRHQDSIDELRCNKTSFERGR